ncbi:MAG TPA: type II toxin-antitoxin system RatA family toxin [Gammaproteobacteria bacterium]|nr:type II toxin-antitoxin system RatA family toxin [Gammaproteobacteria bacterium]
MPVVSKSAIVPHTAAQMYELVDDIPAYPQFLPWCKGTRVWHRDEDEVKASIELARGGIQKTFTTLNRLQKDKMIEMRLVEGPFRRLEGFWRFDALDETSCKVSLDMEYEFSSTLLKLSIGPVFNQITNTLLDAFIKRAKEVYGKR